MDLEEAPVINYLVPWALTLHTEAIGPTSHFPLVYELESTATDILYCTTYVVLVGGAWSESKPPLPLITEKRSQWDAPPS